MILLEQEIVYWEKVFKCVFTHKHQGGHAMSFDHMTAQEKRFWNLLPDEMRHISTISMSYQEYFSIINTHLQKYMESELIGRNVFQLIRRVISIRRGVIL